MLKKVIKKYLKNRADFFWLILIGVLFLSFVFIFSQVYYLYASSDRVKVIFCDVGQGDSILIDFGGHQQTVIDGGPNKSILACLGSNLPLGDRKIEEVVLTHPDADHLRGLNYLVDNYQVGKLYWTGVNHDSRLYKKFRKKIRDKNIKREIIDSGDIIRKEKGKIEFIYPFVSVAKKSFSNLNNSSAVAWLDVGDIEMLLTGDAETELFDKISNRLKKAELLKVSHHGSKNGTNQKLLELIRPEAAFISVGKDNSYGHPTEDVLNLLNQFKVDIYRTDQLGEIEVVIDGKKYFIN